MVIFSYSRDLPLLTNEFHWYEVLTCAGGERILGLDRMNLKKSGSQDYSGKFLNL